MINHCYLLINVFSKKIYKDSNPLDLTYILRPINLNLQIKIVKSETIQFDQPKIEINCVCERIAFVLNEFQYRDILYLLEFFNRYKNSINVCLQENYYYYY